MSSNIPSSKTLVRAVAVFGGAQAFSVLAALVRVKVAAVYIGAAGVGLTALYSTISMLMSNLMGCGLSNSSVPTLSQASGVAQLQVVARLRTVALVLAILSIPVTLIVASFYGGEALWLALSVFAMVLAGVESAILKGLRSTYRLTASIVGAAFFSVVFTVPFYILMGPSGIIWSVVSTSFLTALFTCVQGYRECPVLPDFSLLNRQTVGQMRPMFVLGMAFFVSGILSQGVDLFAQTWLQNIASRVEVGLYKSGYQLAITYTGLIFAAIGNDFYPRLSALAHDVDQRNQLVSKQIRVLLCMVVPLIVVFIIVVPWIIPLLFSDEFLPMSSMVRISALVIILKAVYMPMGYLPVALGKPRHFLLLESVSWLMLALGIVMGYTMGGLTGVGCGLVLTNLMDLVFVWLFCRQVYSFRL